MNRFAASMACMAVVLFTYYVQIRTYYFFNRPTNPDHRNGYVKMIVALHGRAVFVSEIEAALYKLAQPGYQIFSGLAIAMKLIQTGIDRKKSAT
jgi:hypothetical protein